MVPLEVILLSPVSISSSYTFFVYCEYLRLHLHFPGPVLSLFPPAPKAKTTLSLPQRASRSNAHPHLL